MLSKVILKLLPCSAPQGKDTNWCIRACSHYAKFCLICKKICQREAISSANDFLNPPKFLQAQRNFKNSVD